MSQDLESYRLLLTFTQRNNSAGQNENQSYVAPSAVWFIRGLRLSMELFSSLPAFLFSCGNSLKTSVGSDLLL